MRLLAIVLAGLTSISPSVFAATATHDSVKIQLSGTLIKSPPCTFNGGQDVDVDFGDHVMIKKIDGVAYDQQEVRYNLVCNTSDSNYDPQLQMTFQGTGASFGSGLLATDRSGLGIQFKTASNNLSLSVPLKFNYAEGPPKIYAVLTKDPSTQLTGGAFSATATLSVDYQ